MYNKAEMFRQCMHAIKILQLINYAIKIPHENDMEYVRSLLTCEC